MVPDAKNFVSFLKGCPPQRVSLQDTYLRYNKVSLQRGTSVFMTTKARQRKHGLGEWSDIWFPIDGSRVQIQFGALIGLLSQCCESSIVYRMAPSTDHFSQNT